MFPIDEYVAWLRRRTPPELTFLVVLAVMLSIVLLS